MPIYFPLRVSPPILKWPKRIQRLAAYVTADMFLSDLGLEPIPVDGLKALLHLNTPKLAGMLSTAMDPSTSRILMIREKSFVFMFYLQYVRNDIIECDNVDLSPSINSDL